MPWTPKARSLDILVQPRRDRKAALKLMDTSKNSSLEPIRLMPFFVFLNLLKGEPEGVGKLRLAHAKHHAPHAHSAADVNIDRVRAFGPASGHF